MTLGAEEEKQFHSRFPLSRRPPVCPTSARPPTSFSLSDSHSLSLPIFSSNTRCPRAYDPSETRPARHGPHGVVTIVIYISFLFISMTTSLKHRRSEEARNSQRPRGSNSLRLVVDRRDVASRVLHEKQARLLTYLYRHSDYSRDTN